MRVVPEPETNWASINCAAAGWALMASEFTGGGCVQWIAVEHHINRLAAYSDRGDRHHHDRFEIR